MDLDLDRDGCPIDRDPIPETLPGVVVGLKVVTSLSCATSIAASCLVIFTYVAFKNLRTTTRQLLVNLSIADILVCGSHWVGILFNYERFIHNDSGIYNASNASRSDTLCVSQAVVTVYGSISLFVWTMSIALYMLFVTVSVRRKALRVAMVCIYVVSWGLPVPFLIYSGLKKYFGFPVSGSTNCYIVDDDDNGTAKFASIVAEFLTYELWVLLAYLFLPIAYLTVFCHIRCNKANLAGVLAATKTDIKLLLVPVFFLLLRVWTTVFDIIVYVKKDKDYHCGTTNAVLLFFQAIGLNSQGTVNAVLFCLLTKQVRLRWCHAFRKLCRCGSRWGNEAKPEELNETITDSVESRIHIADSYGTINHKFS